MKGYKAFGKGMICRGKQYTENTVFEEGSAEICKSGMHFCRDPLDVLDYYPLVDTEGNITEFAEVEALDDAKTNDGKKYCTTKLKIGAKISFPELVQAGVAGKIESLTKCETKKHDKDNEKISSRGGCARIGSSGDSARIGSSGDSAQIASSGCSARICSSGNRAWIGAAGNSAKIDASGYSTQIASSGYNARISSSGDWAQISSSGDWARIKSTGENSVICCAGHGCYASAKIGSWITLAEWGQDNTGRYKPVCVKTEYVDGARIKEDTMYKLERGEFVEAEE